jgi:hypothetical protein
MPNRPFVSARSVALALLLLGGGLDPSLTAAEELAARRVETTDKNLKVVAGKTSVVVEGLEAGGQAVLIGAAREPLPGAVQVQVWTELISDEKGDGIATYDLGRDLPERSAWTAVEVSTGAAGSLTPAETPQLANVLGPESFDVDPITGHRVVRLEGANLHLIVVRSGVGVWSQEAWDGGDGDLDGGEPDGWLRVDPTSFAPISAAAGEFPGLVSGDLVAVVDVDQLQSFLLRDGEVPTEVAK